MYSVEVSFRAGQLSPIAAVVQRSSMQSRKPDNDTWSLSDNVRVENLKINFANRRYLHHHSFTLPMVTCIVQKVICPVSWKLDIVVPPANMQFTGNWKEVI